METLLRSITCVDLLKEINGKQDHQVSNQTSSTKCQVATPVCFDASLGIVEACLALSTHKISSAPVYDEIKGGFIGMFDFKDLLSFILKLFPGTDVATDVQFDTMVNNMST